jgi:DNA-binding PadR family transcriptional regulator
MKHHHGFGGSARRRPPFDLPDQGEHFRAAFGPFAGPGSGFGPGHDHDFDRMWMGRGGASRLRSARAGRGGRGRRGDVRAAILALLSERPMHGYEMLQELAERTQGLWRPSPGSLYPALQLLEDQGLVQSVEAEGRRRYELTDAGRAELASQPTGPAPWETIVGAADQADMSLHAALRHLAVAVGQVAEAGSDEQKAEAGRLLSELRRQIYLLLAEAPTQPTPPTKS